MKFERLESRKLFCAEIFPTSWVEFEQVGDWNRPVTLGVPEVYELKVSNTHPTCEFPIAVSGSNFFGAIFSEDETTFESIKNSTSPDDFDGVLEPAEEASFLMEARPKLNIYNSVDEPGQAIAEVLAIFPGTGDFAEFSVAAEIQVTPADADSDGEVGFSDFLILSANYGRQTDNYFAGDFDRNGLVDYDDFQILLEHYGKTRE